MAQTFDTPNSTSTYTAPSNALGLLLAVRGGDGGDGGDSFPETGGFGGDGGLAEGRLTVSGGETFTVYIGGNGGDGDDDAAISADGGTGATSPLDGGVSGGDGGSFNSSANGGAAGGGGGAPSAVERDSDTARIAVGAGGGGGSGAVSDSVQASSGGGGGARGGLGGADTADSDTNPGNDASGSGSGGDGADGVSSVGPGDDGGGGGTITNADLTSTSTGLSAPTPGVVVEPLYKPPTPVVSVDSTGDDSIDLSWTLDTSGDRSPEDGFRIFTSTDGGTTFTQVGSTTTQSFTITGLLNGADYTVKVEAFNAVATTSDTATATTTLPDANQPTLGNGVEDEVFVDRETQVTNNGQVRGQIRETGATSWSSSAPGFAETTVAFDTLTFIFGGRSDGVEYEVRLRTETAAATGAWTAPVSIVTLYPGASGVSASAGSPTSITVSWTDNADTEIGQEVIRERKLGGSFLAEEVLTDVGPNTESYVDDTLIPDTQYRYRVRSFNNLRSKRSAPDTETTLQLADATRTSPPPTGYHVQIDREDGSVVEPTILNSPRPRGRLNGLPEVVVPVPLTDQWLNDEWERQPMRVWRDGERLPIEQVDDVRVQRGENERVELVGRGGADLGRRFQKEISDTSAHNVIREALTASGYAFTVDAAPSSTGQSFATLTDDGDFTDFTDIDTLRDPVVIGNDRISPRRTAYLTPLDEIETATTPIVSSATNDWSGTNAIEFEVPSFDDAQWTVDLDYRIPAEHVGLYFRLALDFEGFVNVYLDGDRVDSIPRSSRSNSKDPEWRDVLNPGNAGTVSSIDDLDPGQHTIKLETTDQNPAANQTLGPAGFVYLDTPVLFDTREWDPANFATTTNANERLDGPPGVYSTQSVGLRFRPIQRATGATLTGTFTDTTTDQSIGVSALEDTGYTTTANGASVDADFADSTADFYARIGLGGYDGPAGSNGGPNAGVEQFYTNYRTRPQRLTELDVQYDALGSPTIDETIDNPIAEVVTNKADRANLIWEVQYDESIGGLRVVVTEVGTRTSPANPDIARYAVEKRVSREISSATIFGRTQPVEREEFVGDTVPVVLNNDNIQGGSERVFDSSGTEFTSVEESGGNTSGDYEIDYNLGEIEITNGGAMSSGTTYFIDYRFLPSGSQSRPVFFENDVVETINAIRSDAAAQEAANFVVDALDAPQWEAEVTIPRREAGFNLVETIEPSNLPAPDGETYRIQSVDESTDEIRLTLGARESTADVLATIRLSLGSTAREV